MRIAFFGDASYIGAYEWIRFLAAEPDFEVHAIAFPGLEREIDGVHLHTLRSPLAAGKLRYPLCVPALRRLLQQIAPDLLIAYRVVSYGYASARTGFHPLVMAAQGMFISSRATPRATRFFARRAVGKADLLHSWAPVMSANMVALGADPSRIMELPRGVDDTKFTPGPVPAGPLTMVTTRQLETYYNFPTLLEAVRLAKNEVGEIRYLIAGTGSQRRAIEDLAARKGIGGSVELLGPLPHDRLPALLRSAHLYLAAVPSDGTSSSMLEAMAAGAVPIVADNPSNRHWIADGEGGRLVPAFDPGAYARAIACAWRDPQWRLKARARNRTIVEERASWSRNMTIFTQVYRDLAAGRPPDIPAMARPFREGPA